MRRIPIVFRAESGILFRVFDTESDAADDFICDLDTKATKERPNNIRKLAKPYKSGSICSLCIH
jgi:hypothetical protein